MEAKAQVRQFLKTKHSELDSHTAYVSINAGQLRKGECRERKEKEREGNGENLKRE